MSHDVKSAERPAPDQLLAAIADYALELRDQERAGLRDRPLLPDGHAGCGFQALKYPACTKLLGPVVPGAALAGGARVPGTSYELDPVKAAFNIGAMIRWLDFNDTWLAAEWGHPSDNLGGILAVADYLSRSGKPLQGARRAHRHDQGARDPGRARAGEQLQSRRARSRAAGARGLDRRGDRAARRQPRADHQRRVQRLDRRRGAAHLPARAQHRLAQELGRRATRPAAPCAIALFALKGEMGYPSALSAKTWGFQDVLFKAKALVLPQPFGSYVMENVLFKISFPAEFHAQTAVEAAMALHAADPRQARTDRARDDRDPGARRAHHRQDRSARESGRPRPLHPVHGRHTAAVRPAHRRGLRGRGRAAIRASMRCAPRCR